MKIPLLLSTLLGIALYRTFIEWHQVAETSQAPESVETFSSLDITSSSKPHVVQSPTFTKTQQLLYRHASDSRWSVCLTFSCWRDNDPDIPKRCTNLTAPTDYSGKDGYSPCCVHLLRDMLEEFTTFLESKDREHFIHYGTLLGAYRGDGIIPWTPDVDVAMFPADFETIIYDLKLKEELWDRGLNIFSDGWAPFNMGRVCINENWKDGALLNFPAALPKGANYFDDHAYMDLYMIAEHDFRMISTRKGPCRFYNEWIYPLRNISIAGKSYPAPNQIESVLGHIYGPDWRTPNGDRNKWECRWLDPPGHQTHQIADPTSTPPNQGSNPKGYRPPVIFGPKGPKRIM